MAMVGRTKAIALKAMSSALTLSDIPDIIQSNRETGCYNEAGTERSYLHKDEMKIL